MIRIILLIIMLGCNRAHAQVLMPGEGIYRTANTYHARAVFFPFKQGPGKIRQPLLHRHQIWLKGSDSLYKFGYDTIWGYRSKNKDYRVYEGESYEIKDTGRIWLYEVPTFYSTGMEFSEYFSIDGNAPLYTLDKSHLLAAYYQDTSFVHKLLLVKHQRSILKRDKRTHHHYFEQWLTP